MNLPHFPAMIVFAFIISVAFSLLAKETFAERIKYAAWTFLAFLLVGIALGWLMYPFGR
jgi:NhaP-type Na+/H+ or K+/H+ antiporter